MPLLIHADALDGPAELNAGERPSDPDLVVEDHHGDVFVLAGGGADRVVIAKDRSGNMPLFVDIRGQDGNDFLARGWETDGGAGDDLLKGTSEGEGLRGGAGRDRIFGYAGVDHLKGGAGGDDLCGGASRDHIVAGGGRDRVWCGSGNDDDVRADRRELLRGCEKVFR